MKSRSNSVERRLLIRPGALGDVILSLAALEAAKAEYTEVWVPRATLPLIRFADKTRAIADTGLDLLGVVEGTRVSALETFESIYSWYGANRSEFRAAVRDLPFTFFPALPPPAGFPRIPVPPAPRENFAVIHPFASGLRKRWPLENFRSVAAQLGMPVRWCAGPEDELAEAVRIGDLYELGCWISRARVYIGNDSGISHLAAAVGTPVVAVFLSTDPLVWAPRGERVAALVNPRVEEIVSAARRIGIDMDRSGSGAPGEVNGALVSPQAGCRAKPGPSSSRV
jgi:heptosyltransferase III